MQAKHLSFATIFITFLLLILGGVVHNTESSLACPDWPLCYGSLMPKMEGGVLIEHSHRLLASLVGLLNIALVFVTFRGMKREDSPITERAFRLSSLALFLVIVQGMLGGITVIYRLPTIVSTSHLALSMVYFCYLILIDHELRYGKRVANVGPAEDLKLRFASLWRPIWKHVVLLAGIFIYLQMLLGAFVRHVGAGASCGLGPNAWNLCLDVTVWERMWWPVAHPAEIHMAHRYFALVVTAMVFYAVFRLFQGLKRTKNELGDTLAHSNWLLFFGVAALVSVVIQVFLGVVTVYFNLANIPTAMHLAFAAIILGCLWKLYLQTDELEKHYGLTQSHSRLSDLMELTKPKLSALVMMTVIVGLALAPGEINFFRALLGLILIFMVVAGAASLNCYLEREIDGKMERTKNRSLPAGRLSAKTALSFGIGLLVFSLIGLAVWINVVTALLGAIATLLYLLAYTPLKQRTPMALYVGAVPGAIPPLMGWTTVMGEMTLLAWFLFLILFIWQLPHFLAISIYHAKDYGVAKIQVYPNLSGIVTTKRNIFLFTIGLTIAALLPGLWQEASQAYTYVAALLSGAILFYATRGFFLPRSEEVHRNWARRYFLATVAYLPLLLGSMIFLK